jgi:type 1 fimbriae regulatory protein FimE
MSTRPTHAQHYLGHRNIQHTVRYTEMAPDRFKDFWRGY